MSVVEAEARLQQTLEQQKTEQDLLRQTDDAKVGHIYKLLHTVLPYIVKTAIEDTERGGTIPFIYCGIHPNVPVYFWLDRHNFGDIELKFCILS